MNYSEIWKKELLFWSWTAEGDLIYAELCGSYSMFWILTNVITIFQQPLSRVSNGSCSNGFLKELDSDDGERGVTFRVGKFIGQVTIESKSFLVHSHIMMLIVDIA